MDHGFSIRQADAESFGHVADLSAVKYITTRSFGLPCMTLFLRCAPSREALGNIANLTSFIILNSAPLWRLSPRLYLQPFPLDQWT